MRTPRGTRDIATGKTFTAIGAALIASLIWSLAAAGAAETSPVKLPPPLGPTLAETRDKAPFDLWEPTWLPAGYSLLHVNYIEPGFDPGQDAFSADIWYVDPMGNRLHIWQTNNQDLRHKDPAAPGRDDVLLIEGKSWNWVEDHPGAAEAPISILSARLSDTVTVSVDAPLDQATLERVVSSLE